MKKKHKSAVKKTTLGAAGVGIGIAVGGLTNDKESNIDDASSNPKDANAKEKITSESNLESDPGYTVNSTHKMAIIKEETESITVKENDPGQYGDLLLKMQHLKNSIENI